MRRYGISQNPTQEELARLKQLRRADAARSRTQALVYENARLIDERDRLRAEIARLREARTA